MKICYIANARIPTEKAHGIQIAQMCEAVAKSEIRSTKSPASTSRGEAGETNSKLQIQNSKFELELLVPKRFNPIKKDIFEYYGVKKNFRVKKLPCLDLVKLGKVGFLIEQTTFLISAKIYLAGKKYDVLYSRDFLTGLFFKNIVLEIHSLPKKISWLHKRVYKKAKALVVLTSFIESKLVENKISKDKILIAPDAVDLDKFKDHEKSLRDLVTGKKIVMYVGSFQNWKGADVLLEAAKQFSDDVLFVFVGDASRFKFQVSSFRNIKFVGLQPHNEIPRWLKSADVLILPNSAKEKISKFYTSPMKLFEYMASGVPIVASDLPSVREILNDPSTSSGQANAVLVEPDNPEALVGGIKKVLQNKDLADKISNTALKDVENYTWNKRAQKILNFVK